MNYSEAQRLGAEIERDGFILVNMLSVGNDYAVEMQVKDRSIKGYLTLFSPLRNGWRSDKPTKRANRSFISSPP